MSADLRGRMLGQFAILDKIGEGGYGAVYRARQAVLDRPAVVKVLHPRLRTTPAIAERFLREARLASQLDHPYAAHIYAFGVEPDGLMWLAMELVRGTTLAEYLHENGPLPLERFVPLLERLCEVVHTAHEQGIVHRDIKPANVMVVSRAGRLLPKLLDFGIAKDLFAATEDPPGDAASDDDLAGAETLGARPGAKREAAPRPSDKSPQLTQRGTVMGSPHYMAPEQWINASAVDRRTDIYALGVLAFEALTGSPPYNGKTLGEIARAHAAGRVPALPQALPRALEAVFARALARAAADRFDDALQMARACRDAAGMTEEARPLPRLDDDVREQFLASAPQPLAEAVAALDAARDPRQARDALWLCRSTLARFLGVLALAARSRFGAEREGPVALAALRRIGTELLSDEDWLEVVHAILRRHAERPDVYPLPELVMFCFTPEGEPGEGARRLRELSDQQGELADATADDATMRERLARSVALLSALLREAAFVCDYPLVVPAADGTAERWVGVRRSHRSRQTLSGADAREGEPILVDASGLPALSLAPLVQVHAPIAGAPAEMFVYVGRSERGGKLIAPPFEIHDDAVIDWLRAQMITTLEPGAQGEAGELVPYRGLAAFTAGDADLFFGREQLVDAFVNRLHLQPLIAVVGASGAGKSSFVQAGVVPALGGTWRTVVVRPGPSPLAALASQLRAAGVAEVELAPGAEAAERLGELLRRDAAARGPLLLVIDQLEEVFTLARDEAERASFASCLAAAARSPSDPVRVVFTLRDDFLVRTEALPGMRDRIAQGLQLLGLPAREDLERILIEPARRAGYEFEDPELVDRMITEVADQPGALALLSFTAARMWEHRDRHFRRVPARAYEAVGGVGGALAKHAEALLDEMTREEQRLVREAFRNLVTSEGTRAVLARGELASALGGGPAAQLVIERLVASRLLVAGEGDREDRVEIAHEALLDAWPRLVAWRREDAEGARLRDQLRAGARQWHERGRPRGLLWRDEALVELELWRQRYPGTLATLEQAFATASARDAARGRRLRRTLLAAAFALLSIGILVLARLELRAEHARVAAADSAGQAHQRLLDLRVEQGRRALLARDPMRALAYLSDAYTAGARGTDLQFMLAQASAALDTQEHVLDIGGQARAIAFSPDGATIATGGDVVRLWDAASGRPRLALAPVGRVGMLAFSADGTRLVTASADQTARIWDPATGTLVQTLHHPERVNAARFSPDGHWLATTANHVVRLWDAESGQLLATLAGHSDWVKDSAFSPDGRRLVTWSQDGTARLWSLPGGEPLAVLPHQNMVVDADFSPDGSLVATASYDRTAKLWDAHTGRPIQTLKHFDTVESARFSPDGTRLVTASDDQRATIWSVASGDPVISLVGHSDFLIGARFDHSGTRVLTYAADGSARLWDASTGAELVAFVGHSGWVVTAAIDRSGQRVVTGSLDGTVRIWNARASRVLSEIAGEAGELVAAGPNGNNGIPAVVASGDRLLLASETGAPTVRSLQDGTLLQHFRPVAGARAVWSVDLQHVATLGPEAVQLTRARDRSTVELAGTARATIVAFSSDGGHLAIGYADRPTEIWQLDPVQRTNVLAGQVAPLAIAFGPDGAHVATGDGKGAAAIWDVAGPGRIALTGHTGAILDVAWSADGSRVATASVDKTARIWDLAGRPVLVLDETNMVNSVAFHPSGALIATGSNDATAKVWSATTGAQLGTYRIEGADAVVGWAGFSSRDRLLVVAIDATGKLPPTYYTWNVAPDTRSPVELAAFVRCHVPFALDHERLVPSATLCE